MSRWLSEEVDHEENSDDYNEQEAEEIKNLNSMNLEIYSEKETLKTHKKIKNSKKKQKQKEEEEEEEVELDPEIQKKSALFKKFADMNNKNGKSFSSHGECSSFQTLFFESWKLGHSNFRNSILEKEILCSL
jgi:dolichyl-phosphate-mannose--protein O-mannosyl transferase